MAAVWKVSVVKSGRYCSGSEMWAWCGEVDGVLVRSGPLQRRPGE